MTCAVTNEIILGLFHNFRHFVQLASLLQKGISIGFELQSLLVTKKDQTSNGGRSKANVTLDLM